MRKCRKCGTTKYVYLTDHVCSTLDGLRLKTGNGHLDGEGSLWDGKMSFWNGGRAPQSREHMDCHQDAQGVRGIIRIIGIICIVDMGP